MTIDFQKCCPDDSDLIFDLIFVRLTGNKDSHKILDKFVFGADQTIQMRVTFLSVSHRHVKCCPDNSDFIFDRIFIKLADNEEGMKSWMLNFATVSFIGMSYLPS